MLIEVKAAAVNPSDVKAATGLMPYAVFPRTSGRDYAGVVIDGPAGTVGREVFGSSGDLGIRRDGTHATHLAVEAEAIVEKPQHLVGRGRRHRRSLCHRDGRLPPRRNAEGGRDRAGHGRQRQGRAGRGADRDLARRARHRRGAQGEAYEGHTNSKVDVIDASAADVATQVRELTGGKGADIVFNTVGDPYFQAAHKSLALRGRQILIAAVDRIVQFNILEFYRGQHTYVGIDTLGLSSVATGEVLRELGAGFRQRPSEAVSDQAGRDLSAGAGQGCLCRGRRFVA